MATAPWLTARARATPGAPALFSDGRCWRYGELQEEAATIAARLAAAGVAPGAHVAVLMPNRVEMVFLIHALAALGAVIIPLNVRLTVAELRRQLAHCDAGFLLCSPETAEQAAALDGTWRRFLVGGRSRDDTDLSSLPRATASPPVQRLEPGALQALVFTSGTSGRPRAAMLTFANHHFSAIASAFRLGLAPGDRWLATMPLYHVGGLAIILRSCLYGTAVDLHPRFDVEAVNRALDGGRVTLVSLVPTMLHRLLEARNARPFPPALRCILLGGAAAPLPLLEQCRDLEIPVAPTYGLTEAASQVATGTPEEAWRKPGTSGRPLLFTDVRIAGEDGQRLPAGAVGQILVRGPTVMRGYYAQPQETARALRDGWLHTGDLGRLDDDGALWVLQRRSDLIVSGGENVMPAEVEATLLEHPGVGAAFVLGLPDPEWGQRVVALVERQNEDASSATLTATALVAFCRERLAAYKCPRDVRFVDCLPRTASGKVRRDEARALAAGRRSPGRRAGDER